MGYCWARFVQLQLKQQGFADVMAAPLLCIQDTGLFKKRYLFIQSAFLFQHVPSKPWMFSHSCSRNLFKCATNQHHPVVSKSSQLLGGQEPKGRTCSLEPQWQLLAHKDITFEHKLLVHKCIRSCGSAWHILYETHHFCSLNIICHCSSPGRAKSATSSHLSPASSGKLIPEDSGGEPPLCLLSVGWPCWAYMQHAIQNDCCRV